MSKDFSASNGLRWRFIFTLLGSMGMAITFGLRFNLSLTIVAMINHTHHDQLLERLEHNEKTENMYLNDSQCFHPNEKSKSIAEMEDGPFAWTEQEQGLVLGSYFWGNLITQIPGGHLAYLIGGKRVFLGAIVINMVCTLIIPMAAYAGCVWLMIIRIFQGFGGGVTFSAMNVLVSRWTPVDERSGVSSTIFGGTALGTVISILTSGFIAKNIGWEAVFYIHGGLAMIWCILWIVLVSDSPAQHRFISKEERDYIISSTNIACDNGDKKPLPVPWKKIFSSVPLGALVISHTLNNFGWFMFLVELPNFMRNGLGYDIEKNAELSCLPFVANWIFSVIYGQFLNWAHHKHYISTTNGRKLSTAIASVIPGACLIGVNLSGCDHNSVVILMIMATGSAGAMFSGVYSNHVDLASNFAGDLMGISNMLAGIPGFVVPAFVGAVTENEPGLGPWHTIFYVTAGLLFLEFLIYSVFGTGEEQEWNRMEQKEAQEKDENGNDIKMKDINKIEANITNKDWETNRHV